jgi:hypothetical protein
LIAAMMSFTSFPFCHWQARQGTGPSSAIWAGNAARAQGSGGRAPTGSGAFCTIFALFDASA